MSLNSTIANYFARRPVPGRVALELEHEGKGNPGTEFTPPSGWQAHVEGSLRGFSFEIVSNGPVGFASLDKHLSVLPDFFKKYEVYLDSPRTSTHVHVNIQKMKIRDVYSSLLACYFLEKPLVHCHGKLREGNPFCLRVCDSESLVFLQKNDLYAGRPFLSLSSDNFRYGAINIASMQKFGSLEFRFLKPSNDPAWLKVWSYGLAKLVYRAQEASWDEVYEDFTTDAVAALHKYLTPELASEVLAHCSEDYIRESCAEYEDLLGMLVSALKYADFELQKESEDSDEYSMSTTATTQHINYADTLTGDPWAGGGDIVFPEEPVEDEDF